MSVIASCQHGSTKLSLLTAPSPQRLSQSPAVFATNFAKGNNEIQWWGTRFGLALQFKLQLASFGV